MQNFDLPASTASLSDSETVPPAILVALEARLAAAEAGLAAERASGARTRRQMRVTWSVSSLACLLTFTFGFSPQSRAQFGVTLTSLNTAVLALQAKTASMSVLTDPNTSKPTVRFSGVNVQVVSGSGSTNGTQDGTGNLIIGYNEIRNTSTDSRTGSHNLIVGSENSYSSFGGTVIGQYDTISGQYATVLCGAYNTASGGGASVSGGDGNTASGNAASVSGGVNNTASGDYASVSGGAGNTASAQSASVSGGQSSTAGGAGASVSGGNGRTANTTLAWSAGSQASGGFTSGNFSSP